MTRTEWLHKLCQEALQELNDFEKFEDFLDFKSRLYKYDFVNSLLLWKQMPRATMVADLEIWGRFFRRVRRGTKSIFALDKNTGNAKCVFDISQTYATKDVSIHLWEFEGREDIVRKNLVKEIDDDKRKSTEELIQSLAMVKTLHLAENMKEKITEFVLDREDAVKLEMASTLVTAYAVDTILAKRIGYQLKGMNVEEVKSFFPYLKEKAGIWNLIGNNISNLSRNILQGIERSIKEHEREKDIHRQGERDGIHRGGRRDVSPEYRAVRGGALQYHRDGLEVESLYAGESRGEIHRAGTQKTVEKEDVRSRERSGGDDADTRNSVSGSESVQSGGLHGHSGEETNGEELRQGSSGERVSVPLSLKDVEKVIILHGSGFTAGKYRIYEYFLNSTAEKERIEFLKKEYGIGGSSYFTEQGDQWSVNYNAKGISFHKEKDKKTYSWKEVEQIISGLIKENRYFTAKEYDNYPNYRQQHVFSQLERKKAYWDYENNSDELFLFGKKYEIAEIRENDILLLKERDFPLNTLEIRKVDFEKEAILNSQNDSRWITEECSLLKNGSKERAWVRVIFSENGAIPAQALFSFPVANSLFERLDTEKQKEREAEGYEGTWYDKTKFSLTVKLEDGNIAEITERQDFGDGYGSLYNFLKEMKVLPEVMTVLNQELIRDTEKK